MSELSENQGTIEMKKLIEFLNENGYKFKGVTDFTTESYSIVEFKKYPIEDFMNIIGNNRNDSGITINIEYDNDFDYENQLKYFVNGEEYYKEDKLKKDNEDHNDYIRTINKRAAKKFIDNLIGNKKGGKRSKTMKRCNRK